jgi:hypothetical protein
VWPPFDFLRFQGKNIAKTLLAEKNPEAPASLALFHPRFV